MTTSLAIEEPIVIYSSDSEPGTPATPMTPASEAGTNTPYWSGSMCGSEYGSEYGSDMEEDDGAWTPRSGVSAAGTNTPFWDGSECGSGAMTPRTPESIPGTPFSGEWYSEEDESGEVRYSRVYEEEESGGEDGSASPGELSPPHVVVVPDVVAEEPEPEPEPEPEIVPEPTSEVFAPSGPVELLDDPTYRTVAMVRARLEGLGGGSRTHDEVLGLVREAKRRRMA